MKNIKKNNIKSQSWPDDYHFAAAAVWCALGLDNVRLLISRVPEAIDDGVLGLDEESFFSLT